VQPLSPTSLQVVFIARPTHLEAEISGLASPEGARAVLVQIGHEAARQEARRVLLNCLGILGQTAPYDHQQLGLVLARHLGGVRCALVTSPSKLRGVMGASAQAAGADYGAFTSLAEAVAWLRGPVQPAGA
jgi:hypothetical protein